LVRCDACLGVRRRRRRRRLVRPTEGVKGGGEEGRECQGRQTVRATSRMMFPIQFLADR
jgi:hypothetical protein